MLHYFGMSDGLNIESLICH